MAIRKYIWLAIGLSLLLLGAGPFAKAQADFCHMRISLLTCGPGEELYATFGHTALRVRDSSSGADLVFNYGTFEFGPDFYSEFIRGKLLYSLSVENFDSFVYQYREEKRSVQEQVLQLTCAQKQKLFIALQINAQEDNRYYKYDFLFDNCTTRAGNMVAFNSTGRVVFQNILPQQHPTFRQLLHEYLDRGRQPWSKLGIDLLLGAEVDRKVTNEEAMFLPDYLLKGFDKAGIDGRPLAAAPQTILAIPSPLADQPVWTPALVFSLLLLLIAALSFIQPKKLQQVITVFDFLFFFSLGLAGILLVFMWTGTDHKVCRNNFNLFWALPAHAVAAFYVHSKKRWVKNYFKAVFFISLLLLPAWAFLPQQLNKALIPLVLLIGLRSWVLSKQTKANAANTL